MLKNLMFVGLGILLIGLTACNIKTPEIRGVVLDAETKQPVENAWVTATLEVYSKTVAGDVHQSLFVGKTWTDKEGKFVLPSKDFKKPSFPVSFGSKVESLNIGARAVSSKGYISEGIGLKEFKEVSEIKLFLKPPKDAEYYFLALQGLYTYLDTGRIGVSIPPVPEAERIEVMDIAIGAHESYLKFHKNPKTSDETSHYANVLYSLGYLYKKKRDYRNALHIFTKAKEFEKNLGVDLRQKEYDNQINELQRLLQEK